MASYGGTYDSRIARAKRQIDDALGVSAGRQPPAAQRPPMPQQMQRPPAPQMPQQAPPSPLQQMAPQTPQQAPQQPSMAVRQAFQEGGLATSLRVDPTLREQDMEFVNTRNQHMRELTGKTPYAKGGGAWTRKEGQNPEGGLNAKGRASLKAQGQDIKPPVSAKQAKKSPKAAARRSSFCARMGGMEGPMKDESGKPTRKALALRKWDC